ncbi:MAG: cytidylate kinase family protein [archaeon]
MKITIGGMPGSGKSVVGKFLAGKLGYQFYSIGSIRRDLAAKRGMTINEFNQLNENTDQEVDDFQKRLGAEKDKFVIEGRLSYHFIPDSFKIYFDCDLRVAAERIFKTSRTTEDKGDSPEETYDKLRERVDNDCKRYGQYYNLNCYDTAQFDYVIDTTNLSLEEVKKRVLGIVKKKLC